MYTLKILISEEDEKRTKLKLKESGLTPEEVSNVMKNDGLTKKIKGIKKCVRKQKITFDDYVQCLEEWKKKNIKI